MTLHVFKITEDILRFLKGEIVERNLLYINMSFQISDNIIKIFLSTMNDTKYTKLHWHLKYIFDFRHKKTRKIFSGMHLSPFNQFSFKKYFSFH